MTFRNTLLLLIPLVFISFTNISAEGILRADGKKIVDANGTEIIFRGIGLGGWLVPEGYMFNMSGFANSPTEIRNKVIQAVGEENADIYYNDYRKYFVTEKDIDSISSWGFNMVRMPMHYEFMTPRDQPFVYSEYGFTLIDSLVKWCKKFDIYLILDLHAAPGGQSAEPISDYNGYPSLWESEENKARTIALWKEIASRYKDEETIAGYDLLNEPAWGELGPQNIDLRNLYIGITSAIRSVDTNHIVYIEGNWFATDFTGLTPPWDDNMSYSFHKYWSDVTPGSIQSYLTMRNTYNVPLWMSESGENSNSWFSDFVQLLEENEIGWTWWTIKKYQSISPMASANIDPQFQQLMNYWSGSAPKPSVDDAMTALYNQIDSSKIENCVTRVDVLDALFRRPFDDSLIPFAENKIPGIIYGVNFDYGNLGKAYYDVTPSNVNGNGSYNNGWSYRNEGVDIESCSDQITNGYNVGWIDSGEWLKFTVDIQNEGTYDIRFRVAGEGSEGKLQLLLDDAYLTNLIDVPSTGGWQNWQTLILQDIYLPKGKHELVIRFYFTGFNFNYMEFVPKTVDIEDDIGFPNKYELRQNYPNPFNPSTKISYSLAEKGFVTFKVFDILGKEIATIVNKEQGQGNYSIDFDASNLASGVYLYKLQAGIFVSTKKMLLMK